MLQLLTNILDSSAPDAEHQFPSCGGFESTVLDSLADCNSQCNISRGSLFSRTYLTASLYDHMFVTPAQIKTEQQLI